MTSSDTIRHYIIRTKQEFDGYFGYKILAGYDRNKQPVVHIYKNGAFYREFTGHNLSALLETVQRHITALVKGDSV